jgi:hypothetical protein
MLTHGSGRYGHYTILDLQLKIEKCKQLSSAAGFGTSKISPVPKTRRKPSSSIRPNQTLWEYGFLWPGTQPGTKGLMSQPHVMPLGPNVLRDLLDGFYGDAIFSLKTVAGAC